MARWVSVWLASLLCLVGLFSPCHAGGPHVLIETDRGKLTLELYPDAAPRTVTRFVELVKKGFYNGLTFHRVVPGFVVQGGCPKGTGTGGPGYTIKDEPVTATYGRATVAMAPRASSTSMCSCGPCSA